MPLDLFSAPDSLLSDSSVEGLEFAIWGWVSEACYRALTCSDEDLLDALVR